jgi:hypothetical protein
MMAGQVEERKIEDLAEVYGMLKRDAKDMLRDLLEGVSLWRHTARVLFGVAVLAFALVPLFAYGASYSSPGYLAAGLGLIGLFMLGLGLVSAISGVRYRSKYIRLRQKYTELYDAAKKLG